jgi:hypothetical protein
MLPTMGVWEPNAGVRPQVDVIPPLSCPLEVCGCRGGSKREMDLGEGSKGESNEIFQDTIIKGH